MQKDDFIGEDGFVDVPRIINEGLRQEVFSGLIPEVYEIRKRDFPYLDNLGRIYLDNAATSQQPNSVLDKMHEIKTKHPRGSNHSKNSEEAKSAQNMFDESRKRLNDFFNAQNYYAVFTSGTTESSNCVATRFPFEKNDLLLITEMEHNSEILTPRKVASRNKANVKYVPTHGKGELDLNYLDRITSKKKDGKVMLNLVHASNFTGIINPVGKIRDIMENNLGDRGFIYLDMAQSAPHIKIDLDDLNVDFAGCSAHKMYGPMGIGALFIRKDRERNVSNCISGGSAIKLVSKSFEVPRGLPERLEPGTQNIEGAYEWKLTMDYLDEIDMERIRKHDKELGKYFVGELDKIDNVEIYGPKEFDNRTPVVSFNIGRVLKKRYDKVARELDKRKISVRDGCFCCHIYTAKQIGLGYVHEARAGLMKLGISDEMMKLPGAVRASFAFYNTIEDAYKAVEAIRDLSENLDNI